MCTIPKMIMLRPTVTATPIKMKTGFMVKVMECPEYEVSVFLHSEGNTVFGQVWTCDSAPGWFRTWAELRDRILTCYDRAMLSELEVTSSWSGH